MLSFICSYHFLKILAIIISNDFYILMKSFEFSTTTDNPLEGK